MMTLVLLAGIGALLLIGGCFISLTLADHRRRTGQFAAALERGAGRSQRRADDGT